MSYENFIHEYLAMLHVSRGLMLLKGYRPDDGAQHKTVVEFMAHLIDAEGKAIIEHFDTMRRKRNNFTYDVDITISKTEAQNAIHTAVKFVGLIEKKMNDLGDDHKKEITA
jgi:uncharacterized protein (UPF0332 family)